MKIELTPKQCEYIRNANRRWNMAIGAVRSGKSHLAIQYLIPNRLLERKGCKGLSFILGATQENIERNVLSPMREIWGTSMVSEINQKGRAHIWGEMVYCLGADSKRTVPRLRGAEIKYCYCDEVCDLNEDVFDILKSRLSLDYSCFDGSANPSFPQHFVKQFIDTPDLDIYVQDYTIYDNPFLPADYVHNLENEYRGTVFYDRYILGKWTQAEGLIYQDYEKAIEPKYEGAVVDYCISCDYGTQNAFAALLWAKDPRGTWHAIDEYYYSGRDEGHQKTDADYMEDMLEWAQDLPERVEFIIDPSAASMIAALRRSGRFKVRKARNDVLAGIKETAICIQRGTIKIADSCENWAKEAAGYVWDSKAADDRPVKVADHEMDSARYFVATKKLAKNREEAYQSIFERGVQ